MYAQHFGLRQDPFSIAPDPRYLFMSDRHREALAHLLYSVAGLPDAMASGGGGGFVLLTGDIGTGKTTVCRCFLAQIPANCHIAYIFNPKLSVIELLQSIVEEFHITLSDTASVYSGTKDHIDALNQFLLSSHASGQSCLLIIDEAQNLAADVLEQLRLLTNLETNERKLLQMVLIGQPELRDMLARPELEQLAQRVTARFHLDALSETETAQYISHRLAVAGQSGALPFDRRALKRIYQLTHGVPRRINLLCGRALLGAWATELHLVTCRVLDKAAVEVFGAANNKPPKTAVTPVQWALLAIVLLAIGVLTEVALQSDFPIASASPPATSASQNLRALAFSPPQPPARVAVEPQASLESLELLLPQLPTDIQTAWRELAIHWPLPAQEGNPCQAVIVQHIQCYQTDKLNMPLLRQLDRAGILTLQVDMSPPVHAVLTGLSDQTATLLLAGKTHQVRLTTLAQLWHGDFATYWQTPPNYSADLRDGSTGPAIDWLAERLGQQDGVALPLSDSGPVTLDVTLRERVRNFQAARGITADGQPGPMTFMQLESASGIGYPSLRTPS